MRNSVRKASEALRRLAPPTGRVAGFVSRAIERLRQPSEPRPPSLPQQPVSNPARLDQPPSPPAPWASPDALASQERLNQLLQTLAESALNVYAEHGLPTRVGHYARHPDGRWDYLGDDLDAPTRWAIAGDRKAADGWRFADLEGLARGAPPASDLARAGALLLHCRHVRARLVLDPGAAEDLEHALQLGGYKQRLDSARPYREKTALGLRAARIPRQKSARPAKSATD